MTIKLHGYSVKCPKGMDTKTFKMIMEEDMKKVRAYLKDSESLTNAYIEQLEVEFKKYLIALKMSPNKPVVVTKSIDVFAHAFILHTDQCYKFSMKVFGSILSHYPTKSDAERKALTPYFKRSTYPLLVSLFGKEGVNPEVWDPQEPICLGCTWMNGCDSISQKKILQSVA